MNLYEIQIWLRELAGANALVVNGVMDPYTEAALRDYLSARRVKHENWPLDRALIAFEQLIMHTVGGLAVGPVDGIAGNVLKKARRHWLRGPWRGPLLKAVPGDERMPKVLSDWPKYADIPSFFGPAGSNLTTIQLPFPQRLAWSPTQEITRTSCHKAVAAPLHTIWRRTLAHYGFEEVKRLGLDLFGGCYNMRPMRGSNKLSTHAWGIAWDVDPANNTLRMNRAEARLARPEYAPFWDIVTEAGATSLGKARDFDWMHFQFSTL